MISGMRDIMNSRLLYLEKFEKREKKGDDKYLHGTLQLKGLAVLFWSSALYRANI